MKCHSSCSFKQWDLWHFQYQLFTSKRPSVHWANFEIRGEGFTKRGSLFLRKNLIVSHVIDKELRPSRDSCWPLRGQNWTEVVLAEQGVVHIEHHFYLFVLGQDLELKENSKRQSLNWGGLNWLRGIHGEFLVISLESGVKTYESAWSWDLSNSIKLLTSGRPSLKSWDKGLLMINLSWSQLLD